MKFDGFDVCGIIEVKMGQERSISVINILGVVAGLSFIAEAAICFVKCSTGMPFLNLYFLCFRALFSVTLGFFNSGHLIFAGVITILGEINNLGVISAMRFFDNHSLKGWLNDTF